MSAVLDLLRGKNNDDAGEPTPTRWARKAADAHQAGLTIWVVNLGQRKVGEIRQNTHVMAHESEIITTVERTGLFRLMQVETFSGSPDPGKLSHSHHEMVAVFRRQ